MLTAKYNTSMFNDLKKNNGVKYLKLSDLDNNIIIKVLY